MFLIPKGNKDTQGIGILEVVWKVAEVVIDTCIKTAVQFHDVLHGFRTGREAGTVIIELKLAHELESVYQYPLFLIFLDIMSAYDNLYCGRILQTLLGYRVGPKLRGVLAELWLRQEVVTHQNVFHGIQFRVIQGITYGELASPTLFNVSAQIIFQSQNRLRV